MAKDPRKRFSSCTELSEAMAAALYGSVEPVRTSLPPPSMQPPVRRRAQNIVTAAALLTILGLVTFGRHSTEREVDPDGASLRDVAAGFASAIEPKRVAPVVVKKPDVVKPRKEDGGVVADAGVLLDTVDAGTDAH
jgi:hypothetical protein